jgi:hypothetical protein
MVTKPEGGGAEKMSVCAWAARTNIQ